MQSEDEVLKKLQTWGHETNSVRTMILVGSRANPNSYTDILSDYDVELVVDDLDEFMNDEWLSFFGDIMLRWPLKPKSTIHKNGITRLVRFKKGVRIDFQISAEKPINPSDFDSGYRIILDKDGFTNHLSKPTFSEYVTKKPTKEEYRILVNDFFWDATYAAKNLKRDEIFCAKYMLDSILRFKYLQKMIEWYIALQHDWSINPNKKGRFFKKYLDADLWSELEATFADANTENNWEAFFTMIDLFRKLAKKVSTNLGYEYPKDIDLKSTSYCKDLRIGRF